MRAAHIMLETTLPESTRKHFELIVSVIIHISADLSFGIISCTFRWRFHSAKHSAMFLWTWWEYSQLRWEVWKYFEKIIFFLITSTENILTNCKAIILKDVTTDIFLYYF